LGFHVSAYNDKDSNWPWFLEFLGGGVFHTNNWPPLPAKLTVDDRSHPVTMNLPASFISPDNEWYIWKPSPRLNKDVQVLITLDLSNYPIGFKDVLKSGDLPVVWTNTRYKMLYMNMGHGDKIFTSSIQNKLIEDATLWLGSTSTQTAMSVATGTEISPHAVVVNPKTSKVYAVNTSNDTVTVMDGSTNSIATVGVGSEPMAISVNSVTNKIYVGNSGSGTVSVIDGVSRTIGNTISLGGKSASSRIAFDPAARTAYLTRFKENTVCLVSADTQTVIATVPVGKMPFGVAVDPVTHTAYIANIQDHSVTVVTRR